MTADWSKGASLVDGLEGRGTVAIELLPSRDRLSELQELWSPAPPDAVRLRRIWLVLGDRLTVITPTFERRDHAQRSVAFWKSLAVPQIVVDGSRRADTDLQTLMADGLGYYQHLPKLDRESSVTNFYRRIRIGLSTVESEFALVAGDDMFHIPSGLDEALRQLDLNSRADSAAGSVLSVEIADDATSLRVNRKYNRSVPSHFTSTPSTLRLLLAPYLAKSVVGLHFYNVWRTSQLRQLLDSLTVIPTDSYFAREWLLQQGSIAFHGALDIGRPVRLELRGAAADASTRPGVLAFRSFLLSGATADLDRCQKSFLDYNDRIGRSRLSGLILWKWLLLISRLRAEKPLSARAILILGLLKIAFVVSGGRLKLQKLKFSKVSPEALDRVADQLQLARVSCTEVDLIWIRSLISNLTQEIDALRDQRPPVESARDRL